MKFGAKKQKILTACRTLHALPGRLRLESESIAYLTTEFDALQKRLFALEGVESAEISRHTNSILIFYDQTLTSQEMVFEAVEYLLASYSLTVYREHRTKKNTLPVSERRIQNEPIQELVSRVVATGISVVYALLRPKPTPGALFRRLTTFSITAMGLSGPIINNGFDSLAKKGRPNAETLSSTAILASLLAGKGPSALTIILLADLAELLTAYSMDRTRRAIRQMLTIGDDYVWLVRDSDVIQTSLSELNPGDSILVHTGEKISVDGKVVSGRALVDQSPITGEYMPVEKSAGDTVYAGTLVKNGECTVEAEKVGDETSAGRIIKLVEDATLHKADIQNFADRFSAQFIPVNFGLALLVFSFTRSVDRALNMLIIDYFCGVRLSTATAIASSIAAAARQGVLIKGGNYIEQLSKIDTLVLDKTGTVYYR
jgi:manganese/zinc-transporting P-type ATPase C